jgi:hypothetical protein
LVASRQLVLDTEGCAGNLEDASPPAKKKRRDGQPEGIRRAGLLVNEPPATGEVPFI